MPVTEIDERTALVVIDLQKGIVNAQLITPIEAVVERTCALLNAFRKQGLPIALVSVAGTAPGRTEQPRRTAITEDFAELIPELNRQPEDIVVTKYTWGAFPTTDLEKQLKDKGVTQVVLAGVATGTGVEATARQAYELGFNVTLAIDAMTDTRAESHAHSIANVFPRLGETGTSEQIIALLAERNDSK